MPTIEEKLESLFAKVRALPKERQELAVDAQQRRTHRLEMEVGRPLLGHQLEESIELHDVAGRPRGILPEAGPGR